MRYLYLIRHAQHDDDQLTEDGVEQARLTARALRKNAFTNIYHSTMPRAVQTASLIAQSFPEATLRPSNALRECVPSVPSRLAAVYAVNKDRTPPTEDNTQRCAERLEHAFAVYFMPTNSPTYDMLVCHGNVIRYFVARVLKADAGVWVNMAVNHCGISIVQIQDEHRMTLISHNDTGHLPDALRTQG